jgi:hypothetical protein
MPAIHAISTLVMFAWMPGSGPGMTAMVPGHEENQRVV